MTKYDAESIKVLKDAAHVRERPGMYIQNMGADGLHQLVKEVLDNAVDEYMAGHVTEIAISHYGDGSVRVQDNGRGQPVHPLNDFRHHQTGNPVFHHIYLSCNVGSWGA